MHDLKNILLAWISSATAVLMAIDEKTFITIITAIVLPTIFFAVGKVIDVCVQIYFRRSEERQKQER